MSRPRPDTTYAIGAIALVLGAGASLGANGYDDIGALVRSTTLITTIAAALTILLAIVGFAEPEMGRVGGIIGLLLGGYELNVVVQYVQFTHTLSDASLVAAVAVVLLSLGGAVQMHARREPKGQPAPAAWGASPAAVSSRPAIPPSGLAATATSAPAGWYPDPAGGGGQRYWDGSSWQGVPQ